MRRNFQVIGAFDTETTTIGDGPTARAFPILYIFNDWRGTSLSDYYPGCPGEDIALYHYTDDFLTFLYSVIEAPRLKDSPCPVVCAYNLIFDLASILPALAERYKLTVCAQSSRNVYYLDIYHQYANSDTTQPLLRFWDTFHLERGGLYAMGETAGVAKLTGDWDYSLIRTPETPLTPEEIGYAKRDVQVIPAYLKYLLDANEWLTEDMFGYRVITSTSLVRQMAIHNFGQSKKKRKSPLFYFQYICRKELPPNYNTYALRKSCFRGGWAFTAGEYACKDIHSVSSLDVTSMHHTFINGRMIPVNWKPSNPKTLTKCADIIMRTDMSRVLLRYEQPFSTAFHAEIAFKNVRLKQGSCFEKWGIAITSKSKFGKHATGIDYWGQDPVELKLENNIREKGWYDTSDNATFAFGKLLRADTAVLHLNEIEAWCFAQVYDFDHMRVITGESTSSFIPPPDYVTLQSHMLYEQKKACKKIVKEYDGTPYKNPIPSTIPVGIAESLRSGTLPVPFLANYYENTVKSMFNAIYGTMAQDIYKPDFLVEPTGDIAIDHNTVITEDTFSDHEVPRCRVLYTYGMRIVAGSRMHLVIAMMLLYARFHGRVYVTGGDTDSLKCHVPPSISDSAISKALLPLAESSHRAITMCCKSLRSSYPDFASDLEGVGSFDIENPNARYEHHMEYWNKARCSYYHGTWHVVMAGLRRPIGKYHIEHVLRDFELAGYPISDIMSTALGYGVEVGPELSFSLEEYVPEYGSHYTSNVTDYLGCTYPVDLPQVVALYSVPRLLGDRGVKVNRECLDYMTLRGDPPISMYRELLVSENQTPMIITGGDSVIMKGIQHVQVNKMV